MTGRTCANIISTNYLHIQHLAHNKMNIKANNADISVKSLYSETMRRNGKSYPALRVVFSGGVASNSMLRKVIAPLNPVFSQPQFSTDNAMGVAVLAHRMTEE